jgi:hypothetical protein
MLLLPSDGFCISLDAEQFTKICSGQNEWIEGKLHYKAVGTDLRLVGVYIHRDVMQGTLCC